MTARSGYAGQKPHGHAGTLNPLGVAWKLGAGAVLLAAAIYMADRHADDPRFITTSAGWFDFNRQHDPGAEFRVEYRSNRKFWVFKPFAVASVANNGMTFTGAGVLIDVHLGPHWVVTPSFAVTWWRGKTEELDLGHPLEFRSQLEVAYKFEDRSRLGLSVSHYSNADIVKHNPGSESLMLNHSLPLGQTGTP